MQATKLAGAGTNASRCLVGLGGVTVDIDPLSMGRVYHRPFVASQLLLEYPDCGVGMKGFAQTCKMANSCFLGSSLAGLPGRGQLGEIECCCSA